MAVELREPARRAVDESVVAELERLWMASPDASAGGARSPLRRSAALYDALVRTLVVAWPTVLAALIVLAPAPAPGETHAPWLVGASVAIVVGPIVAGLVGSSWPAIGLGLSAVLGGLGIAGGIACRATAHHSGSWWAVETVAFSALAALSLACLAARARR